jgi:hypothetical protein
LTLGKPQDMELQILNMGETYVSGYVLQLVSPE